MPKLSLGRISFIDGQTQINYSCTSESGGQNNIVEKINKRCFIVT
jgi:hypothetical protein